MPINAEFATNPDPRCACVLLLDTSGSMPMDGDPIHALNQGLKSFEDDLKEDPLARRRVEIAIVTFGNGGVAVQEFTSANKFSAPSLSANGTTPMGEAMARGLQLLKDRKAEYKANGVAYYQPWMFLITDGEPTDEWQSVAQQIQAESAKKALLCFAVGVNGANMHVLSSITPRAIKLDGLRFRELFLWLSQSQKGVSSSRPGEQTALPSAAAFCAPISM